MLATKIGWALVALFTVAGAVPMCLDNGIPPEDRVNITIDGKNMPLGIFYLDWPSATVNAELFMIIASEAIGINAVESGRSAVVEAGNWAIAGCPLDETGAFPPPGCSFEPGVPVSTSHVVFETFDNYMHPTFDWMEANSPDRMPLDMGSLGYDAQEYEFLAQAAIERAREENPMISLDNYAFYDDNLWTPHEYLDTLDQVNTSDLFSKATACSHYAPMNVHDTWERYVKFVGDVEGTVSYVDDAGDTKLKAYCPDGKWWLSPACRADRTHCIPYFTNAGWGLELFLQKITHYNMAIAVLNVETWDDWVDAVNNNYVLSYWWVPDTTFMERDLRGILFPRLDKDQQAQGHYITSAEVVPLHKWTHVDFEAAHHRAYSTVQNYKLSMGQIMGILTKQTESGGTLTLRDAACDWLKANQDTWKEWIPDVTACLVGQGLTTIDGELACQWCPQATSSQPHPDLPQSRLCVPCGTGTYQELSGQSECLPCPIGTYAGKNGSVHCDRCTVGFYQDLEGKTSCQDCNAVADGMTTQLLGATIQTECMCPPGTYETAGRCVACAAGHTCESFDMQFPMQAEGYFVQNQSGFPAWHCKDVLDCPQGVPGTCGVYRDTEKLACAQCQHNAYKADSGECKLCGDNGMGTMAPIVVLFVCGIIALPVVHACANFPLVKTISNSMQGVFLGGMAVTTVMTFNIYYRMDLQWEYPLSSFFAIMRIFAFNLSIIAYSCVVGSDSQIPKYTFKILAVPMLMIMLILSTCLIYLIKPLRRFAYVSTYSFFNTLGLMFTVFFIPVSLMSLEPFQCANNPSGKSTLAHDRSVVCFQWDEGGEHEGLVWLSIIAVLVYPVSFLAVTGLMTFYYSKWINRYGVTFSRYAKFLTTRMEPSMYHFGFLYNLRNFVLTLAPVIFPNSTDGPLFLMLIIFISWHSVAMYFKPWRFPILTHFDGFATMVHIIVLFCFTMLADSKKDDGGLSTQVIGWVVIVMFLVTMVTLICVGLKKIQDRFFRQKEFGTFLSHHKTAAGLAARQCKMLLQEMTTRRHFLDVDELANLDDLLFTVRSNTENLVVLMTPEILGRFWCAAEIACSYVNKVPIILLAMDKVYQFEEKYLENVHSLWSQVQIAEFSKADITTKDIEDAYKHISKLNQIRFQVRAPYGLQKQAMEQVVERCVKLPLKVKKYAADPERCVFITFDTKHGKQYIVANILYQLFQAASWTCKLCEDDMCENLFKGHFTSALGVVLISSGTSKNPVSLGCICAFHQMKWPFVCVQSQEEFTKPENAWFNDMAEDQVLEAQQWSIVSKIMPRATGAEIATSMKALYRVLAWRISPERGEGMMQQEFFNIITRVEAESMAQKEGVKGCLVFQDIGAASRPGRSERGSNGSAGWKHWGTGNSSGNGNNVEVEDTGSTVFQATENNLTSPDKSTNREDWESVYAEVISAGEVKRMVVI